MKTSANVTKRNFKIFKNFNAKKEKHSKKKNFPCPYMMVYLSRFHVIFGQKFCQKIFNAFGRSKEIKIKIQLDKKKERKHTKNRKKTRKERKKGEKERRTEGRRE